jgi:hypothetical protein
MECDELSSYALHITVYVLAMVGHLENVSSKFVQMANRITNVEFTTVSPTIANTMLAVRAYFFILFPIFCTLLIFQVYLIISISKVAFSLIALI